MVSGPQVVWSKGREVYLRVDWKAMADDGCHGISRLRQKLFALRVFEKEAFSVFPVFYMGTFFF